MKIACFFLLTVVAWSGPLERKGSHYFIRDVFVEGRGPFRFLLDTGAESCAVSERLATALGIRPEYRVEQVTPAGIRVVPAGRARVRVGAGEVKDAEVLLGPLPLDADGVLGQSFLRHFDYVITRDSFELDPPPVVDPRAIPLRETNGVPVVRVSVDGAERELVLDSGAPAVLLFGREPEGAWQIVSTSVGSALGSRAVVRVAVGGKMRVLEAVWLPGRGQGLLPVAAFRSVYVSNRRGYAVLR